MALEASGGAAASGVPESVPRPGDVVGGKFVVERVLGVGGMGVVVAAYHRHLEQTVAIKFLRRDASKDDAAVSRFLQEARAVAALRSQHVVRVMDAGLLDDGLPYLVMEHLIGTDLDQVLVQKGSLTLEETIEYLLQAMEAVAEAHSAGIVHRDLKPSNLFLIERPDGAPFVKVLDFGISKALDVAGRQAVSLTATSMTLGSPLYMSPEQVRSSKTVDARTDIWALGIIAYELLAGVQPFEADTVTGLCAKIVADEPLPLRSLRPDIPPAFEAVVMRCLEKNVAARYQSVAELAGAMRPFASAEGILSVSRIKRMGGGLRPTLASAQGGRETPTLPAPGEPTSSPSASAEGLDSAAGYAETVAAWQTTGTRRGKRALAATAGTAGGIALLVGSLIVARAQRPLANVVAPSAMVPEMRAGAMVQLPQSVAATPVVLPSSQSLAPAPAGSGAPAVAASGQVAIPRAVASAPSGSPAAARRPQPAQPNSPPMPPAKTPVARTQDELLLDRK